MQAVSLDRVHIEELRVRIVRGIVLETLTTSAPKIDRLIQGDESVLRTRANFANTSGYIR